MKAICRRDGLLAAFGMVSGVVPTRSPKPILQNVKLVAHTDRSVLMATDLEVGIRYEVSGLTVEGSGEAILPTGRVNSILHESRDEELVLEATEDQMTLKGQHSQFVLPAEDPEQFPDIPEFETQGGHLVQAKQLREMIRRTAFATDVESTRYALNGVLVELNGTAITLVGTDGRRLALMKGPAKPNGGSAAEGGAPVVPTKAMRLIEKNLQNDDEEIKIAVRPNEILVQTDRAMIYSRLVEGRFPRYQDVFPKAVEAKISLEVGPLLSAVRQASIITSEESRGVDFAFAPGTLTLTSKAADVGQSHIEMPIAYDGKPVSITFDPRYLQDMLKVLAPDTTVTAELIDHKSAAVFRTGDQYTYVVMPLTRDR